MNTEKIVYLSELAELLQRAGWMYVPVRDTGGYFKHENKPLIPIQFMPDKPDVLCLAELVNVVPDDLRIDVIAMACPAEPVLRIGLVAGHNTKEDMRRLLSALDHFCRALGGPRLAFHRLSEKASIQVNRGRRNTL